MGDEEKKKYLTELCEVSKKAASLLRVIGGQSELADKLVFLSGVATGLAWPQEPQPAEEGES